MKVPKYIQEWRVSKYEIDESEWRELCNYEKVIAWKQSNPYHPEGEQ